MRSAYGYALHGDLLGGERWLPESDESLPLLRLDIRVGEPDGEPVVDDHRCLVRTAAGGWIAGERARRSFVLLEEQLPPGDVVAHPRLSVVCALAAHWDRRPALHGAAVTLDGRAVLLVGDREAGKSTTALRLQERGWGVLCDDLAVVHGGVVQVGPRCVDSRTPSQGSPVRGGLRWRSPLKPAVPTPLAGVVILEWADDWSLQRVPPRDRFASWTDHAMVPHARCDAVDAFEVLAAPWWRLGRPRNLEHLDTVDLALRSVLDLGEERVVQPLS